MAYKRRENGLDFMHTGGGVFVSGFGKFDRCPREFANPTPCINMTFYRLYVAGGFLSIPIAKII